MAKNNIARDIISLPKANMLVKEVLLRYGYSVEVEIENCVNEDSIMHYAIDYITYHGKPTKKITQINNNLYIELLNYALQNRGYLVDGINFEISDEGATYELIHYKKPHIKKRGRGNGVYLSR